MKKLIAFALLVLFTTACSEDNVDVENCSYSSNRYRSYTQITQNIVGTWVLKKQIVMLANAPTPNVKIVLDKNGRVEFYRNDMLVHQDTYRIESQPNSDEFRLVVSSWGDTLDENRWFVSGTIYLCQSELFLDNGIAFDAPGYVYQK
jgi:hypothetical protein